MGQAVRSDDPAATPKGSLKIMFGSNFQRHLVAAVASILMSSIAIGAAVAPSDLSASPIEMPAHA